jgi:hypothetical protein
MFGGEIEVAASLVILGFKKDGEAFRFIRRWM